MEGLPMHKFQRHESAPEITHEFVDEDNSLEVSITDYLLSFYTTEDGLVRLKNKANLAKRRGKTSVPDFIYNEAREYAKKFFRTKNTAQSELDLTESFSKEDALKQLAKIKKMLNE
jgi:hypothetical protein